MCEDGRVRGVRYTQCGKAQALATDFVVDAGGRKSQAPHWLTELGFRAPEATTIGIDIAYASTKFRVPEGYDRPERILVFMALSTYSRWCHDEAERWEGCTALGL
jgi:hypothetical protein